MLCMGKKNKSEDEDMYNVSTSKIDMNLTNCLMVQISLLAQDNHISYVNVLYMYI